MRAPRDLHERQEQETCHPPRSLEKREEVGMNDAHGAIGITLIHHAGDVDLARSCS